MDLKIILSLSVILCLIQRNNTLLWWYHREKHVRWRRWWVRPINRPKRTKGSQHNLYNEMLTSDHDEFHSTTRMWPEQFEVLVELVKPYLTKRSIRRPLSVRTRLAATLAYLAQGDSAHSIHQNFRIGKSTAHAIIPETCRAIWLALQPIYLPSLTQEDWKSVSDGFFQRWQFPNCLGAIDGRHMKIKKPKLSGSTYYNYKGFFSIVLKMLIENAFGIVASRWQLLQRPVSSSVSNAIDIFKAIVCLHNFLMEEERKLPINTRTYCPLDFVDSEDQDDGGWRAEGAATYFRRLGRVGANNAGSIASGMRNYLKAYFNSNIGYSQAPWQFEMATRGREINVPNG